MLMVMESINEWAEDIGFLGQVHGGFIKERRTYDNFFMLDRELD